MLTGLFRRYVTFIGTALALGVVSCLGVSIAPFLTPGVFNALWKTSDLLLRICEKQDFDDKIKNRSGLLKNKLDNLETVFAKTTPYYRNQVNKLTHKLDNLTSKGFEAITDDEKTVFLRDCFSLARDINENSDAAPLKACLVDIADDFCAIEKDVRENPHRGWTGLLFDFGKSVAGLLSGLGIIETNVLAAYKKPVFDIIDIVKANRPLVTGRGNTCPEPRSAGIISLSDIDMPPVSDPRPNTDRDDAYVNTAQTDRAQSY